MSNITLSRTADYTTKGGAEQLAHFIRDYWHRRGYDVKINAVRTFTGHGDRHDVRSSMIGGWP